MVWQQIYDPFDNPMLSTIMAAVPVVVMLASLAFFHIKAHLAGVVSVGTGCFAVGLSQKNLWRGSLLPLECVALTKIGNGCQIFGAAAQPNASKLARHKGRHD